MFGEIELGDELEVNGMWADQLEYLELTIIFRWDTYCLSSPPFARRHLSSSLASSLASSLTSPLVALPYPCSIYSSALIPILLPLVIVIVWTNFISVAHLLRHFDIEVLSKLTIYKS